MHCSDASLAMRESAGADGRLRLALSGYLDIATAPCLDLRLRELEHARRRVELDLERLTFIDLQGLRVIHTSLIRARREAWMLDVRPRVGTCVRRLLALTGVELWPIPQPRGASIQAILGASRARTRSLAPSRGRMAHPRW